MIIKSGTVEEKEAIGGIVGINSYSVIIHCVDNAKVESINANSGGIVGRIEGDLLLPVRTMVK